jgi:hypothetical protein
VPRGIWGTFTERFGIHLMPVGYRLQSGARPADAADVTSAA